MASTSVTRSPNSALTRSANLSASSHPLSPPRSMTTSVAGNSRMNSSLPMNSPPPLADHQVQRNAGCQDPDDCERERDSDQVRLNQRVEPSVDPSELRVPTLIPVRGHAISSRPAHRCGETEALAYTFHADDRGHRTLAHPRGVSHCESMADRPYHDYATSALRELELDLSSSQAELEDERADYARRADADIDDLRRLDRLISGLGHQLAAIDRELLGRRRIPVGRRL
jgi:hypothetical protein